MIIRLQVARLREHFRGVCAARTVQAERNGARSNCRGAARSRALFGRKVTKNFVNNRYPPLNNVKRV